MSKTTIGSNIGIIIAIQGILHLMNFKNNNIVEIPLTIPKKLSIFIHLFRSQLMETPVPIVGTEFCIITVENFHVFLLKILHIFFILYILDSEFILNAAIICFVTQFSEFNVSIKIIIFLCFYRLEISIGDTLTIHKCLIPSFYKIGFCFINLLKMKPPF